MGYDYHWSGSQPGASSPVDRSDGLYTLRWSIARYVEAGVPRDRILLGLPVIGAVHVLVREVHPDQLAVFEHEARRAGPVRVLLLLAVFAEDGGELVRVGLAVVGFLVTGRLAGRFRVVGRLVGGRLVSGFTGVGLRGVGLLVGGFLAARCLAVGLFRRHGPRARIAKHQRFLVGPALEPRMRLAGAGEDLSLSHAKIGRSGVASRGNAARTKTDDACCEGKPDKTPSKGAHPNPGRP